MPAQQLPRTTRQKAVASIVRFAPSIVPSLKVELHTHKRVDFDSAVTLIDEAGTSGDNITFTENRVEKVKLCL